MIIKKGIKGISPVVATALLIVVAVVAVVGFQSWFQTYSSSTFSDVEMRINNVNNLNIETIVEDTLYIKSGKDNVSVNTIKIGGIDCNVRINLSKGMNNISVANCLNSVSISTPDIVVIANNEIVTKKVYLKNINPIVTNTLCSDLSLLMHFNNDSFVSETNTFFYDWSDSGNNGTLMGSGVSYINSGKFGKGLIFDNLDTNNGCIEVSSNPVFNFDNSSGMSVFMWFNKSTICDSTDNAIHNEVFISIYGNGNSDGTWWFGCDHTTSGLRVDFYPNEPAGNYGNLLISAPINDSQWHLGGWVYDENTGYLRLYLDGVETGSVYIDDFENGMISANEMCIGAYGSTVDYGSFEYDGLLDELAIWNRSLSSSEVSSLYNSNSELNC